MRRLSDAEREKTVEDHINSWREINLKEGTSLEIDPGKGVEYLEASFQNYKDLVKKINKLLNEWTTLLAERTVLMGDNPESEGTIRFKLMSYKRTARNRLGAHEPLSQTIPNVGRFVVERYVSMVEDFLGHWEQVNTKLPQPLVLGHYTRDMLQTDYDKLVACLKKIRKIETSQLPLLRAEREKLYGDIAESDRDRDSIVTTLLLFRDAVLNLWPNQPYSQALPELFPSTEKKPTPTFPYNWLEVGSGEILLWYVFPELPVNEATLYLQEGSVEQSVPLHHTSPGNKLTTNWGNVTIIDGIDLVEIRDAEGRVLAEGKFDNTLAKPA